jgi:hypothetical protein
MKGRAIDGQTVVERENNSQELEESQEQLKNESGTLHNYLTHGEDSER